MASEVMASKALGNTKARAFLLTLNEVDHYERLKEYLTHYKTLDYLISASEEAPTTGHRHIHVYAHFKNMIKLNITKCEGAHIDICRGSPKQNIEYVSKDGCIIDEIGTRPRQGTHTIKDIKSMTREEIDDLPWNMRNIAIKIKDEQEIDIDIDDWKKDIKVYWICGPSGVGKTERAKQIVHENKDKYGTKINIVKFDGSFWSGIGSAKIAIYDDFRDSHMKPSEFINFIDYNRQNLNIKGGYRRNEYELIIITSVQHPEWIYSNMSDSEPRRQWIRRMEIIELKPPSEDLDIDDLC